jgi:mannose-1-phosphate guanylyltransferase / mannose-6-phosphate isomerase
MGSLDPHLYAVVLAGGSGTRFWPLSRELFPKQLLKVLSDRTLLQQTVGRVTPVIPVERVVVVTGAAHADTVRLQLGGELALPKTNVLVEPVSRNTAPAIAWAAAVLRQRDPDAIMVVMPADHVIGDQAKFLRALKLAADVAQEGWLVTFGIKPVRPETGYGYIETGSGARSKPVRHGAKAVKRFVEKPDARTAQRYCRTGTFYWNSGIFVWRADTILNEMEACMPELFAGLRQFSACIGTGQEASALEQFYLNTEGLSIDYGVMQKTRRAALIPAPFRWSDIGNWGSLEEVAPRDAAGNVRIGAILDRGSTGSVLYGEHRLVATIGLKDMVVVDTADATLVCPKNRAQEVKQIVESLRQRNAPEQLVHRTVERPWGHYTVLEEGPGYKVKRVTVKPGGRLSLQLHNKRSEHWVVTAGVARVTCDRRVFDLHVNESTAIPRGSTHRLENPGDTTLHIIETQCGDYLGEDDIVRLADDYDRAGSQPRG